MTPKNQEIVDFPEEGDGLNGPHYLRWIKRGKKLAMERGIDLPAARRTVAEKIANLSEGSGAASALGPVRGVHQQSVRKIRG